MGFAADAITDVITPPPRAERTSAPDDDGPSFAEHLDAHAAVEDAPRVEKSADKPQPEQADEYGASDDAVAAAPPPPPQPETPPAPPMMAEVLAQLQGAPVVQAPSEQAKSAQTPDIAAPATPAKDGDCVSAPQAQPQQQQQGGLLGLLGLNQQPQAQTQQQPTAEQTAQAATVAPPTLPHSNRDKSTPRTAQPASQTTATTQGTPAPQPQTQTATETVAAATQAETAPAPAEQTEAKSRAAQGVTLEVEPLRGAKSRAAKAEAPATDAPATANAQAKSTPIQQALAALRDGAAAANASDSGDIKIAAPAQTSASQTATALAQAPAQASQATAEHAAQRIAPASAQVAREIVRRFNGGSTSFEMRLDPAELGRIDVRLEVSRDNKVSAVISADSPQALQDLVRHSRELEASLQSAGLDLAENGLSFDLNQSRQGFAESGDSNGANARQGAAPSEDPTPTLVARPLGLESWRGVRVDVTA